MINIEGTVIVNQSKADETCSGFPITITNLITDTGDQMLQKKFTGQGTVSSTVAGMKLGNGTGAAAKTGAGSWIPVANYVASSALAFDSGYPTVSSATANAAEMKVTWTVGVITGTIAEAAIMNNTTDAGETDSTGTFARAVFPTPFLMELDNKMDVRWIWTFIGS